MENSSLLSALVPQTTEVLIITLHYVMLSYALLRHCSYHLLCPYQDFAWYGIFEKDKLPSLIEPVYPAFYKEDATTSMTPLCKELQSSHTKET